jgi:hypothetical protein
VYYGWWFVIQVKMTDMQVRGTPRDLLPGDPYCAPLSGVLAEAYISLLRKLSTTDTWSRQVECLYHVVLKFCSFLTVVNGVMHQDLVDVVYCTKCIYSVDLPRFAKFITVFG